ncbi:MAG TPA: formyltransferase family protein [Phycisphaerales bacterium]|nr:formyltransferase family protein [Phycisphaerales bacterium]
MSTGLPNLAIMVSGGGRTLENLLAKIDAGELAARVGLVIASRECRGAEIGRGRGIDTKVMPGVIDAGVLEHELKSRGVEWVVLGGYLNLLKIPASYAGRFVNIHPALLPSFGGAGMYGERVHRAVIGAGCRVSGCTVHLCDERYDTGPILAQRCCEVREDDTVQTLAARVFALECEVYPRAIGMLIGGKFVVEDGRARVLG